MTFTNSFWTCQPSHTPKQGGNIHRHDEMHAWRFMPHMQVWVHRSVYNFFFKVNFYLMSISIWRRKSQYTEEECKKANNFKASVLMLQMANFSKTKVRQYVYCESHVFRSNYIYCAFFHFQFWDMFRPTWSLQIMLFKKEGEWGSVRWWEGWFSGEGWHGRWLRRRLQ